MLNEFERRSLGGFQMKYLSEICSYSARLRGRVKNVEIREKIERQIGVT